MPATSIIDSTGAAITVGAIVKLQGIVTAINPFSGDYREVTVVLANPLVGYPDVLVAVGAVAKDNTPGPAKTIRVPPTVLTLGV